MIDFDLAQIWRYRSALFAGLYMTLALNIVSFLSGTILAFAVASFRLSKRPFLRLLGRVYVDLFRTLPLLVLLVWLFFALPILLPQASILSPFTAAVIALSLNLSGFLAEIIRSGIEGVPRQHIEAAELAGMTRSQVWRFIIVPLALRLVSPSFFGQYVNQMKLSVLASVIAVPELLHTVNTIAAETFRPLELYTTLAALFLVILLPMTWFQAWLERRFDFGRIIKECPLDNFDEIEENPKQRQVPHMTNWPRLPQSSSLCLNRLSVHLNERRVLTDVSITIPAGRITALMGANGCGKTTLVRTLAGLTSLKSGSVLIFDGDGEQDFKTWLQGNSIGYVSQEREPWPHLTVAENLIVPLRCGSTAPIDVEGEALLWLQLFDLENQADLLAGRLSGGQKQRLIVARALCQRPPLLLLDEPTSALDKKWTHSFESILQQLTSAGVTIVLVSHSINLLRAVADHVVFLDKGRVKESGPPQELLYNPQTSELAQFLAA